MRDIDLQVRRVRTAEDAAVFRKLVVEYENSLPAVLRHTCDGPPAHDGPNVALVAFAGEAPAGCVALKWHDASTGILQRLYVVPAYRQCGIARALVTFVIETSRTALQHRIVLDTDRELLSAAYELYATMGFKECDPYGDVEYQCPTYMELVL